MKRRKYLLGGLVFVFALVISALGWSGEAFAATNVSKNIFDKAVLQGVMQCYQDGGVKTKIDSLAEYDGESFDFMLSDEADEVLVPLVTGWVDTGFGDNRYGKFNSISCRQLFNGVTKKTNLFSYFGKELPSKLDGDAVVDFVENMGYIVENRNVDTCYHLAYTTSSGKSLVTNSVCENSENEFYVSSATSSDIFFKIDDNNICLTSGFGGEACEIPQPGTFSGEWLLGLAQERYGDELKDPVTHITIDNTLSSFESSVLDGVSAHFDVNATYKFHAGLKVVEKLSGYDAISDLLLDENSLEKRLLYQAYLTDYYNLDVKCGVSSVGSDGEIKKWLNKSSGKIETCYFWGDSYNESNKVNGVKDGYFKNGLSSMKELIAALDAMETSDEELAKFVAESESDNNKDLCPKNSGPLGWLLCPVVTAVAGVGESLWNTIESDFMQIPAGQLFDGGGGVVEGWRIVQGIANVAFIILFLVVIFSQLTGVGIDNYGIKKILPKLVVVAVLMNLSLLLCQVAVDLSNVLGSGINNLLTGLAGSLPEVEESSGGAKGAATAVDAMLGGGAVGLFGVLTGGATLAAAAAAVGIAALGIVISVVASIIFMYLILIVRQAGVVLAIVIAPIAIVCYMLPNTEKLYKKWFSLFKALLVVYPICGALIGAGQLAGAVLGSVDNTGMKIAAMLVQVLPFFLIPMLLKNSLALMGNVGAKLSTWGRQLGRRGSSTARQGIRNTERFKNFQNEVDRRRREGAANRTVSRLSRKAERNGGRLSNSEQRLLARSKETIDRMGAEDITASTILARDEFRGKTQRELEDAWDKARNSGDYGRMEALTNVMAEKYGGKGAAKFLVGKLSGMDIKSGNAADIATLDRMSQTLRRNRDLASSMKDASPDAYQMINSGGIGDGKRQNLDWFSEKQNVATKNTDFAKMSPDTVERMVKAGGISRETAKNFLASNDKDVVDALSDEKKRKAWENAAGRSDTGGDVYVAQTAGGTRTFTRREDGRYEDENGNNMGGEFSVRVERKIKEDARKAEIYQGMSDNQILNLATDPNPKSHAIQNSAVKEAKRRGLDKQ